MGSGPIIFSFIVVINRYSANSTENFPLGSVIERTIEGQITRKL